MNSIQVIYDCPLGQRLKNPTEQQLADLIFSTDDKYWLAGSGEGELRFFNGEYVASLGLKKVDPYGFRLFFKSNTIDEMMVAVSRDEFDQTVPVFSGGEYYNEPIAFFFDATLTYEVVKRFCKDGAMPPIRWEKWVELTWPGMSEYDL